MVKQLLKRALGAHYTPRMRHLKRRLEVRFLGKGEPELALLPRVLDPGAVSIDIGANIGDYLDVLTRHSRRVIAFEPHPVCFANLQAIGLGKCTILNLALSDRAGTAMLTVPVEAEEVTGLATIEPANRSFAPTAARLQEYEVRVARLDDALAEQLRPDERVAFIKIDVEGHEHAVIAGAQATIGKHRPIVLLETEYRHGAPIRAIFELFAARGYLARILHVGRMTPVDPVRLRELQRDYAVGDIVKDVQVNDYVNNVWFIPGEQTEALARLGADG
ncbi:MAG: FkbM family methyltransferase [Geminicoccaceae bacterium]